MTVGELFGRSGYGVALSKGSPWTAAISLHVLRMHEFGEIERLDNFWIESARPDHCSGDGDAVSTLRVC